MIFRKPRALLLLLTMVATVGALHAAEGDVYTLLDDSNLRQGPDSSYASVGVAQEGEEAVEINSKGHWLKVRIPASGDEGWLYADSLARGAVDSSTAQLLVNSDAPETPKSKTIDQSGTAPDVTVANVLSSDPAPVKTVAETQSKSEAAPSMFVDGAVGEKAASSAAKAVVSQNDVAVSELLDNHVVSETEAETAANVPVAQSTVVPDEKNVDSAKSSAEIKVVTNSKVQNVIEAGELDAQAVMIDESLPVMTSQETGEPVSKPEMVAHDQGSSGATEVVGNMNGTTAQESTGKAAIQHEQVEAEKPAVVVRGNDQQIEVVDVLNEYDTTTHAVADRDRAGAGEVIVHATIVQPEVPVLSPSVADMKQQPETVDVETKAVRQTAGAGVSPDLTAVPTVHVSGMRQVIKTTTIRTASGSTSDVLGWIGKGTSVEAIEKRGDWFKVRMQAGGRTGWVEAVALQPMHTKPESVDIVESPANPTLRADKDTLAAKHDSLLAEQAPVLAQVAESSVQDRQAVKATDSDALVFTHTANLRAGPDSKFDVVAWAGKGSYAREKSRKGDWVRVQMQDNGRIGWAHKSLLQQAHDGSQHPLAVVMSDQVTETPAPVSTANTQTPIRKPAKEPVMVMADSLKSAGQEQSVKSERQPESTVAQPEVVAVQSPSASQERSPVAVAGTTERNLLSFNRKSNMRSGPDAKFDVVSWAGVGSYASELARKGDWVRVQMQVSKRIGWVYNRSLELVKAGVALPVASIESDQVKESPVMKVAGAGSAKAADSLFIFKQTGNLHAGPGKQYDVVAWGGKHESASVIDHRGDWRQVRMTISGKVGWVFHSLLASAGVLPAAMPVSAQSAGSVAGASKTQSGDTYLALRTEPLRSDAIRFSELTGWISRGESVVLLERRDDWLRVKPQGSQKKAGWVKADLLKKTDKIGITAVHKKHPSGVDRVVEYQDRVSKGEAFNFSYAALEEALYRVPVEDIHVRIGKDDLKSLFRKDLYDKSSFEIRVRTGRRHLQGRIQVLGSSTRIFKKKSLLIKLDKESSRWYGKRRIALRSMASDKALMREWMTWKLLAAMGAKVPEVHFTRVSFNHGEKTGLYLSIEWMGGKFLAANHLDASGGFYQPNDASHCGDLNSSENLDLCFDKIAPQDGDYSMLSAMAQAISSAPASEMHTVLAQYFNDESVIDWIVVNALVTNGDTYNKNYWLQYSPTSKKWTLIPWDYNLTFGRVFDSYAERPFKIFNDNFQYFFPPDVGASNPLKDKAVRNPRLRSRLETKLKHLLGLEPNGPEETFGWFSPTVMQARIGNLAAVVGKEVYKDTFLTYGEEDFTKTYESLMHYVTAHDHYLKAKLQGPFVWQPSPPFDPTKPAILEPLPKELYGQGFIDANGQSLHMTDQGWGYFVARMNLDAPLKKKAEFKVHVEGDATPKYLPTGQAARRCVRRTWIVSTETRDISANGSLMLEYTQENSKRTEVPETLHEELLELWVLDGHHWKPLKTDVNEYSNTLTAKDVRFESGHVQRFVACSPF